jgi:hypothetical protein
MQSYVKADGKGNADLGLLERVARNASIAGLAGVALSGLLTMVPTVPTGATVQWVCAGIGACVGLALAFVPRQAGPAVQ